MVVYTHATWHVRPGHEAEFEAAWRAMGQAFEAVPGSSPLEGTLLRRRDDPAVYVSFGPWPDHEAVQRMRDDPRAQAAMAEVMRHCIEADPGSFDVVAVVKT